MQVSVGVTPQTATLEQGTAQQLTATVRDASGNPLPGSAVSWASSDPAVASVDASGLVSAVAPGTATVTATSEGRSAAATITVPAAVDVPINYDGVDLGRQYSCGQAPHAFLVGPNPIPRRQSLYPSGIVVPGTRANYAFVDGSGAVVLRHPTQPARSNCVIHHEPEGTIMDLPPGQYRVFASYWGLGANGRPRAIQAQEVTTVTVTSTLTVAAVRVNPNWVLLNPGGSQALAVTVYGPGDVVLTAPASPTQFVSSDPAVATVDGAGRVTAVGVGQAVITASNEGVSTTAAVIVEPPSPVGVCGAGLFTPPGPGYVLSDYSVNDSRCPSDGIFNVNRSEYTYVRSVIYTPGTELRVCFTQPFSPPAGWEFMRGENSWTQCGGSRIGYNVAVIRRLNVP